MKKHADCKCNPHGCRLVSDGLVCQKSCDWLSMSAAHGCASWCGKSSCQEQGCENAENYKEAA